MFTCTVCGEKFTKVVGFNKHRTGGFTQTIEQPHRHCLTPRQMINRGMVLNGKGIWVTSGVREVVRV